MLGSVASGTPCILRVNSLGLTTAWSSS